MTISSLEQRIEELKAEGQQRAARLNQAQQVVAQESAELAGINRALIELNNLLKAPQKQQESDGDETQEQR